MYKITYGGIIKKRNFVTYHNRHQERKRKDDLRKEFISEATTILGLWREKFDKDKTFRIKFYFSIVIWSQILVFMSDFFSFIIIWVVDLCSYEVKVQLGTASYDRLDIIYVSFKLFILFVALYTIIRGSYRNLMKDD